MTLSRDKGQSIEPFAKVLILLSVRYIAVYPVMGMIAMFWASGCRQNMVGHRLYALGCAIPSVQRRPWTHLSCRHGKVDGFARPIV